MFRIAREAGIRVEYCHLPLNDSISAPDRDGDFVLLDYSLIGAGPTERVHLAHEIGHCTTGSFYNRHTPFDIRQKHENRADRWAIKKLVPKDDLDDAIACGITEPWELAEYFSVTEDFMKKAVCYYTNDNLAAELYF